MTVNDIKRGARHLAADDKAALAVVFATTRKQLFEHGYAGTNINEVASRAGVSVKSVNKLFPTKVDLLRGVIADTLDEFLFEMADAINDHDLVSSLTRMLVRCADLVLDRNVVALNRVVITEGAAFPEIADAYYEEGVQRVPVALGAWLVWHRERGELRVEDPKTAASMLVGMMICELQRSAVLGLPIIITADEIRERARACAVMFLNGCAVH